MNETAVVSGNIIAHHHDTEMTPKVNKNDKPNIKKSDTNQNHTKQNAGTKSANNIGAKPRGNDKNNENTNASNQKHLEIKKVFIAGVNIHNYRNILFDETNNKNKEQVDLLSLLVHKNDVFVHKSVTSKGMLCNDLAPLQSVKIKNVSRVRII